MSKYWYISSPITVHVEVTEACNERCRHCYNFSRSDKSHHEKISWDNLNYTIAELIKNKVMHVIITGGEPLLALDRTIYLAQKSLAAGMSVSLNSNIVAATNSNLGKIKEAGIDHILTTLHSYREDVHDYVADTPGAFKKIINGIKLAQENNIIVTVNTILSQFNKDDIYQTGKFVYGLGLKKYLVNRTIPSPDNVESFKNEFHVGLPEARRMFDDLLRLKEDLGMQVGTCRTVPQCLFGDLNRYGDFLARGCAAGKRHLLLNVNGDSHACVHESKSYGNIHKLGLKGIWDNMACWRTLAYIPNNCQVCHLFDICDGGCRLVAQAYSHIGDYDNLRQGAKNLPFYGGGIEAEHIDAARNGIFKVNPRFSYRKENGFYIVRTDGARVDFIDTILCESLIECFQREEIVSLNKIGEKNLKRLAYFIKRGLVVYVN